MKRSFYDDCVLKIPRDHVWRIKLVVTDTESGEEWVNGVAYSKKEWQEIKLCDEAMALAKEIFNEP